MDSYAERALLTRLRFHQPEEQRGKFVILESIDRVKFFVQDAYSGKAAEETFIGVPSLVPMGIPKFVEHLQQFLDGFKFEFENEALWERRIRVLQAMKFAHELTGTSWEVDPDMEEIDEMDEGNTYFNTLRPRENGRYFTDDI